MFHVHNCFLTIIAIIFANIATAIVVVVLVVVIIMIAVIVVVAGNDTSRVEMQTVLVVLIFCVAVTHGV